MIKTMLKQIKESEKETVQALLQFEELRKKLLEAYDMEDKSELQVTQIPFAAYEMALERAHEERRQIDELHLKEKEGIFSRHEKEKESMQKHYRNIIKWIVIPFIVFIVGVFGTVAWFFNNYDFASYVQDGDGINNYLRDSTQGDLTYEPAYPGSYFEEQAESQGYMD